MKIKVTIDGKDSIVKVRDKSILEMQMQNRPVVYKNKKKYSRKIKHKGREELC